MRRGCTIPDACALLGQCARERNGGTCDAPKPWPSRGPWAATHKGPLDVYRDAAIEERERQAAEGGIGCGVLLICCAAAGVARWLGWI